jgi:hypothetical protein
MAGKKLYAACVSFLLVVSNSNRLQSYEKSISQRERKRGGRTSLLISVSEKAGRVHPGRGALLTTALITDVTNICGLSTRCARTLRTAGEGDDKKKDSGVAVMIYFVISYSSAIAKAIFTRPLCWRPYN